MDDSQAIAALLGEPRQPTPADLAAAGLTAHEIASTLGIGHAAVVQALDGITPGQLRRIAQTVVDRAVGSDGLAPHVQAAQFILANHVPEQYGRQAVAGEARIRVIVDRDWSRRAVEVSDGVIVPATLTPSTGE
jgi:hypothetical protein